jgi:deoxyhypusine synthase
MIVEITAEEMFAKMAEDRKKEETIANKQIILNSTQEKIYVKSLTDGFIDLGIPGIPLDNDTNIVVDYLNENHKLTNELKDNNMYGRNEEGIDEVVEELPQTFVLNIIK